MTANNTFNILRRVAGRIQNRPMVAFSISRRAFSSSVLEGEDKSLHRLTRTESEYKLGKHRSNALELISKVAPIEVEGDVAVCDGGGGALGHPLEYIKVGNRDGKPVSCIYCGLKYSQKGGGHH